MTGCSGLTGMVLGEQLKCSAFGSRADINWQVGPAGLVANDPLRSCHCRNLECYHVVCRGLEVEG